MPENSARRVTVSLAISDVTPCAGGPLSACCPGCDAAMDLVQPEVTDPEHLVGSCADCGRWYLLSWLPGRSRGVLVLLPGFAELGIDE